MEEENSEKSILNVYQIGLSGKGRRGFETLIELTKDFQPVDVRIQAVCEKDFEKLKKAEKFAEVNDVEIETFQEIKELYEAAKSSDERVMIYDPGTQYTKSENIYESMENGFFHLAEKPPSLSRKEHIKEKKLAEREDAMWKVDFIERENPVVKKALEAVEDKTINRIKIFRESSVGIENSLDPMMSSKIKGGDIFDKMINDVYVLDFLERSNEEDIELELQNAETEFFLPNEIGSEKLVSIHGSKTSNIENASTAQTEALFKVGDVSISLNSSWMGLSKDCMLQAQEISKQTGHKVYSREFSRLDDKTYLKEEARFFVIEGDVNLIGDLLNNKLFDLDNGEEIETSEYIHSQLHRVLEEATKAAVGIKDFEVSEKETDLFINALFDIRDKVVEGNTLEEASKGSQKLETLIVEDQKVKNPFHNLEVAR